MRAILLQISTFTAVLVMRSFWACMAQGPECGLLRVATV